MSISRVCVLVCISIMFGLTPSKGQNFEDILIRVSWHELKTTLLFSQEFNRSRPFDPSRGIFNIFPNIIIDLDTTVTIQSYEQAIFTYAAVTNNFRKQANLQPIKIWISTQMRIPQNRTSFHVNSFLLLAQQPNQIFPGTITGFMLNAPSTLAHPESFKVMESEAENVKRALFGKNMSLWISVDVDEKCTTQLNSSFENSKFSFALYDDSFGRSCPEPPYGSRPYLQYIDDCLRMRETFSAEESPKLITHRHTNKYFDMIYNPFPFSYGEVGGVFTNLSNYFRLTELMLSNCEITVIPDLRIAVIGVDYLPVSNLNETLQVDRNLLGFSIFFDALPPNPSALFQEMLNTVSKVTITNLHNLTPTSASQINVTIYEILYLKEIIESSVNYSGIDSVPIEISILLSRYGNTNPYAYKQILDQVFSNAVAINKASLKIISTIVLSEFQSEDSWNEILRHLETLEEQYPDQSVYGPEFGIAVNAHHCYAPDVARRVQELRNSSVTMQIWPEDNLAVSNLLSDMAAESYLSYPRDDLDKLVECKKTFQDEGFTSNNIFLYATILVCRRPLDFEDVGWGLDYTGLLERLRSLSMSLQTFITISTAFEYTNTFGHDEDTEFPYGNSSEECVSPDYARLPDCSRICAWWRVHQYNDTVGYYGIKNQRTIALEYEISKTTTAPWYTQSSTKQYETETSNVSSTETYNVETSTIANSVVKRSSQSQFTLMLVLVIIGVLLVTLISAYFWLRYRQKRFLPESEVHEFYNGSPNKPALTGTDVACSIKYNKLAYEISRSSFEIDTTKCLGSGEFGIVYAGTLFEGKVPVAIKTLKKHCSVLDQSAVPSLRGLLSEIKILSFLGDHNHIIKLYGANTDKLRSGNILVILEFCDLGSLASYLRNLKSSHYRKKYYADVSSEISLVASSEDEANSEPEVYTEAQAEDIQESLYKWSTEIACGMEYIASKKLVHADLATRNVLLDCHKTAKIADFGLSRRLYNYTHYLKTSHEPLPWRWMAPEALNLLEFCEKTDVWAYGVTLWEIYMLGDTPYPGLSWDVNFPNMLKDGLKLGMPTYDDRGMYKIMKQCWEINPELRPTFLDVCGKIDNVCKIRNPEGYVAVI